MKVIEELPGSLYYSGILRMTNKDVLVSDKRVIPVIVSLTSIPSRLSILDIAIKSVLNQNYIPEKIYLWLNEDVRDKIPLRLQKLVSDYIEIKYSKLDCPHLKLVETLRMHPDKIIVTCDDDFIYRERWMETLYENHLKYPKDIIANATSIVKLHKERGEKKIPLALGAAGILYPLDGLDHRVLDENLFLNLAPKADDLWFRAMSILSNTKVRKPKVTPKKPLPVIGSQKIALKHHNVYNGGNVEQWKKLTDYFKF